MLAKAVAIHAGGIDPVEERVVGRYRDIGLLSRV